MKPISRFAFLGTFLATITAWAQTIITPCRPKLQWGNQIPLCNGQCPNPECAYRAPEFQSFTHQALRDSESDFKEFAKLGIPVWALHPNHEGKIPIQARLNRCPNCNTAFFQDPEPAK